MSKTWLSFDIDLTLDRVLEADSQARFNGTVLALSRELGKSETAIKRFIWGLATRLVEYDGGLGNREVRTHLPLTWTERYIISTASLSVTKDSRKKGQPDAESLSRILNRSLRESEALWNAYGPARGREGFGL